MSRKLSEAISNIDHYSHMCKDRGRDDTIKNIKNNSSLSLFNLKITTNRKCIISVAEKFYSKNGH